MLSKAQIKHIRSLSLQKYRQEYRQFVVEGEKTSAEWLRSSSSIDLIVAEQEWIDQHTGLIAMHQEATLHVAEAAVLSSVSSLKTPNKVLLVVPYDNALTKAPDDEWVILLDGIRDPGNMGSILRIADWFGIKNIVCSKDCVDVHNAKVIQAAMGSHLRVRIFEEELANYIEGLQIPVFAAVLNGENIYKMNRPSKAAVIIGNEGAGIRQSIIEKATHKITIPSQGGAESLNAAVSTGIICALLMGR
ncbi:MAG TPA: RNA methyltransferase [Flavipsychrobacter sp.]|nr:RNA methyltransferase [Flavipsychrobacter sp.]